VVANDKILVVFFGDENLQVYARYSFDLKTDRGIMEINVMKLKVSLDEGPRYMDHSIQTILLVESFKLVPTPLDEGPRPKSGKLRLIWHLFWRENELV